MHFFEQYSMRSCPSLDRTQARASKRSKPTRSLKYLSRLALAFVSTCAFVGCSRVVLVTEASPIRIGPDCRTQVYTLIDGEWRLGDNRVVIPEGWWVVPPSYIDSAK
jgi:hypothetical protein